MLFRPMIAVYTTQEIYAGLLYFMALNSGHKIMSAQYVDPSDLNVSEWLAILFEDTAKASSSAKLFNSACNKAAR